MMGQIANNMAMPATVRELRVTGLCAGSPWWTHACPAFRQ